MYRPPKHRRRQYPPRPHQTAPIFYIVQQPYESYGPDDGYDEDYERHHYRYTEQHYPEDIDEDNNYDECDDGGYEDEQEFRYQQQPSGGAPRHTDHRLPRERKQYQQQPSGAGPRSTDHHSHRERNSSESSSRQTSRQTSSRSDSGGKAVVTFLFMILRIKCSSVSQIQFHSIHPDPDVPAVVDLLILIHSLPSRRMSNSYRNWAEVCYNLSLLCYGSI